MHLLLFSVGCAASGSDRSANFIGTSSIILPNISLNIGILHWHYNNTLNQLAKAGTVQTYLYNIAKALPKA
jgi:hypothetical protein